MKRLKISALFFAITFFSNWTIQYPILGIAEVVSATVAEQQAVEKSQEGARQVLDELRSIVGREGSICGLDGYRTWSWPDKIVVRIAKGGLDAGLQLGDQIVAIDSERLNHPLDDIRKISKHTSNDTINIAIERGGVERVLKIKCSEARPEAEKNCSLSRSLFRKSLV